MFEELCALGQDKHPGAAPQWMEDAKEGSDGGDDPWEEEKSWRDPSAHKVRGVVGKWVDNQHAWKEFVKVRIACAFIVIIAFLIAG